MSPRKDQPHIKYLHPGPFPIYVGFTTDEKAFNLEIKRLNVNNPPVFVQPGANGTTHVLERGGSITVIVCIQLKRGITREQVIGLIVHEAVHCWQETRKAMREDEPSIEIEAYTVQYYAQGFLDEMARLRKAK